MKNSIYTVYSLMYSFSLFDVVNPVSDDARKWSTVPHKGSFLTVYLCLCNLSPCLKKKSSFWDYIILNPPPNSHCKVLRIIIFCIIHPSVADQEQQCSRGQQGRDKLCPHPSLISSQLSIPLESQVNAP